MSNQFLVPTGAAIPANILALFGQPPLLSDESKMQYNDLLSDFANSVEARDIVEWFRPRHRRHSRHYLTT